MRDSVPWMGGVDERILERLADDGDATAWEIAFDVLGRVSQSQVSDRCAVLADAELVERHERKVSDDRVETYWSISTWGEQFLSADVDPSLDVPIPKPRPPHATRPGKWAGF
ncbi:hypothetical protein [Halorubrum tebenquichense]|uniref:Putative repressor phrH2 n=1 Tax=Halorubrum tebenquichense DSM 14210 TaxID=1227485 RepID=M0DYT1_9EURY|nr:hypothetical protein [Halorubrum tebenquichense]ELZ40700.1 putative repressor phrH2 [Halorubrum tebenquichense DSM 14210]